MLIILIVLLIFINRKPGQASVPIITPTPVPVSESEGLLSPSVPTIIPSSFPDVLMGTNQITIRIPGSWEATKESTENGEKVIIVPKNSGPSPTQSLSITTEINVSTDTLQKHKQVYQDLGYTQAGRKIQDIDAAVYTGVLPLAGTDNTIQILQNRVILFSTPGRVVTISYHYVGKERRDDLDQQFEHMIDTLTLL